MAIYHFHMRTPDGREILDEEGADFPDDHAAEREALGAIIDLKRNAPLQWSGCAFEVFRGNGDHVVTFSFDEAQPWGGGRVSRDLLDQFEDDGALEE